MSDGTRVRCEGGCVVLDGTSAFAQTLRHALAVAVPGDYPRVQIGPMPGGTVPLDPASAWLVDRWIRDEASRPSLKPAVSVASSYEARFEDAPASARAILARTDDGDPNVIH